MVNPQDSALVIATIRAGTEPEGWPGLLSAVQAETGADSARFWLGCAGWDVGGALCAPRPEMLAGLRLRRVYTGAELADRALGPTPFADARALGVAGPAWVLLTRKAGEFRARDSARLAGLVPHLEQALELGAQMAALRDAAARAGRRARRLGAGWLRLGPRGEVVAADAGGRELLARAGLGVRVDLAAGLTRLGSGVEAMRQGDEAYLRATDQPLPPPERLARHLGLSLPEARLARALGQGASLREAAALLGLTIETARFYSKQIYAKTGLRGQPALIRRLWTGALTLG